MKKRITILMTTILLAISVLSGCGAESTTTEPTETVTVTTTEESATKQTEEATATPEETAEPTPETKEETSEETTAETEPETTETTETAEPEPTEEPTPEPEPQVTYTYTDMSATMYAQQTVNVRDLPDTSGNKIGSLSANDEIIISGQCNETGWYMFEYNDSVAFVSNKYIGENKVEVQQQVTANNGSEQAQAPSTPASNYEKNVWYDMGEYFFIMCNSQEEANYYYGHHYEVSPILEERYPDRGVYIIGRPNYVTLVAALYQSSEGFPYWPTIDYYVPEVGMPKQYKEQPK
ncbi:MAG: SH3 domain-containing protein [Lachnospiraceae bacterium]|nr:SH3 domain-containing protein [Lachnospiraceae bacterium]